MYAEALDLQGFESIVPDDGVLKKIVQSGLIPVKPRENYSAVVEIRGTYEGGANDGKVFESSEGRKSLHEINLRKNCSLAEGLRIALLTMELGELCEVILNPPYGYENGEALRYRIKLIDITAHRFALPRVLIIKPQHAFLVSQKIEIHVTGYCDDKICHDREASLLIGDTDYDGLPKAIIEHLHHFGSSGGWIKLQNSKEISAEEREKFGFPPIKPIWYKIDINSYENMDEYRNALSLKRRADYFFQVNEVTIPFFLDWKKPTSRKHLSLYKK